MTFNVDALAGILERAGRDIIMPAYQSVSRTARKSDGSIVTATDLACQTFISEELYRLAPEIAFLSEEMKEADQLSCLKHSDGCYWCLDPLDGTTNFVANIPAFGCSLALIVDGSPKLACIHDPVRQETFIAEDGCGARLNGEPIRASLVDALDEAVGYIDFKRLSADQSAMLATRKVYRSQRNIGSCALEWAWLAAGRGDFIIHGGEKIWDFAAGSLLAIEAGCRVGDFSRKPVFPAISLSSPILATATDALQNTLCTILDG